MTIKTTKTSLNTKFLLTLCAGLVSISAVFLLLYMSIYRSQFTEEQSRASMEVNRLLQTTLENAMLKRDLDGLRLIVSKLGQQDGIENVHILNPELVVRFSSGTEFLGTRLSGADLGLCPGCDMSTFDTGGPVTFMGGTGDSRYLRSVNPVKNRHVCSVCHGDVNDNPVNGLLLVDYDASAIENQARHTTLFFLGSGGLVILLIILGAWWFMQRQVLRPIHSLVTGSEALTKGELSHRVPISGEDELSALGRTFNQMAEKLQRHILDISDRHAFLQGALEAMPDGVRIIDSNYNVLMVNTQFCELHGRTREETLANPCYVSSHQRQEPCPVKLESCPIHEIQENSEPFKFITRHRADDGEYRDVEVHAAPVYGTEMGKDGFCIIESIRDLKKDLKYSHEQKLSELGQLAAGVAHEIYNPLTSIRIALQSSSRALIEGRTSTPEVLEYLNKVDGEIDHCVDITSRLLKLTSSSERPQLVVVEPVIRETAGLLRWEAEERGITIDLQFNAWDTRVFIPDSDLRMLVLNLVQNAIHAMPAGGKLEIATEPEDRNIRMDFRDEGVGIDNDVRKHIFTPFFSHRADGVDGTGLGLSICLNIVRNCGGAIDVESEPGKGSCFSILLPIAEKE